MLVVGDKEAEGEVVAVRRHKEGDIGAMPVAEFRDMALDEVSSKKERGPAISAG
jgi:threonyl-tRNA synthetase